MKKTIYEALKSDHVKVIGLLDELIQAEKSDSASRTKLVQKIRDELIPHARAEEAVLYNCIRDIGSAKGLVAHSYQEHMEAESLLRSIQVTDSVNMNWVKGAKDLKKALQHHIQEEEEKIFPAAKQLFTEEEAVSMAEVFEKMKPLIQKQSFIGQSADLIVNLMPDRLRDSFTKFIHLPVSEAS